MVHICAPGSPQVEAVVDGLLPGLARGAAVVDCSTADPVSTERLAERLGEAGVAMADAPLAGTPAQAAEGQLGAMVGAGDAAFARLEPILATWAGAGVRHVGPVGAGHKLKLLNNFFAMGYAALYAEGLTLARRIGVAPETLDGVIRGGRMDSGFYRTFMGYALEGDRDAHKFTLTNALKDMTYLASTAQAAGVANPMGAAVRNSFAQAVAMGGGGPDDYVPHLIDFVAEANGLDPKATDG